MSNLGHHLVFPRLETGSKPTLSPQQTDQVMTIQPGDITAETTTARNGSGTISSKPSGNT
jgi:hypothetical protein